MHEMEAVGSHAKASTRWHYLVVAVVAAVLVLWRLGDCSLDEHEAKLALPARNMFRQTEWLVPGVDENDRSYAMPAPTRARYWLVPILNGVPRLVKTPLGYWTAAGMAYLHGEANEWTTRLSSAVAAVLVALIALRLGRRMFSERAALLGGVMLATSLGLVNYGRNARPEMLLTVFCTAAMTAFYLGLEAKGRGRRVLWMGAFWLLMGLANLAKQSVPFLLTWSLAAYLGWRQTMVDADRRNPQAALRAFLLLSGAGLAANLLIVNLPGLDWWRRLRIDPNRGYYLTMAICLGAPMLWYLVRARVWRQVTPLLPTAIPGVTIMFLAFVPWMWYMARLFGGFAGTVFSYEIDLQATGLGNLTHAGPPWFYITFLLMLTVPWFGFLPGGLSAAFSRRFKEERPALVYLFLWSVGLLLLFTAAVEKRKHYILPMLPAVCLSMGFVAEDVCWRYGRIKPKLAKFLGITYGIAGALMVVATAGLPVFFSRDWEWFHMIYVLPVGAVLLLAAGWLACRGRLRPLVPLVAIAFSVLYLGHNGQAQRWDRDRGFKEFGRRAAEMIPAGDPVYEWESPQARTVFQFGRQIPDIRWQFEYENPLAGETTIRSRVIAWLAENPAKAPWIVACGELRGLPTRSGPAPISAEEALSKLGYAQVLVVDVREDGYGQLVLYRYSGTPGRRASGS